MITFISFSYKLQLTNKNTVKILKVTELYARLQAHFKNQVQLS